MNFFVLNYYLYIIKCTSKTRNDYEYYSTGISCINEKAVSSTDFSQDMNADTKPCYKLFFCKINSLLKPEKCFKRAYLDTGENTGITYIYFLMPGVGKNGVLLNHQKLDEMVFLDLKYTLNFQEKADQIIEKTYIVYKDKYLYRFKLIHEYKKPKDVVYLLELKPQVSVSDSNKSNNMNEFVNATLENSSAEAKDLRIKFESESCTLEDYQKKLFIKVTEQKKNFVKLITKIELSINQEGKFRTHKNFVKEINNAINCSKKLLIEYKNAQLINNLLTGEPFSDFIFELNCYKIKNENKNKILIFDKIKKVVGDLDRAWYELEKSQLLELRDLNIK